MSSELERAVLPLAEAQAVEGIFLGLRLDVRNPVGITSDAQGTLEPGNLQLTGHEGQAAAVGALELPTHLVAGRLHAATVPQLTG
jgi:hypothetical protein